MLVLSQLRFRDAELAEVEEDCKYSLIIPISSGLLVASPLSPFLVSCVYQSSRMNLQELVVKI